MADPVYGDFVATDASTLHSLVLNPSSWQWIIHGDSKALRGNVVAWMLANGRAERARDYAACGTGDRVFWEAGETARIKPHRCGVRWCPRCSRYAGQKFVRRVEEHLAGGAHGSLHHMVLTQRTEVGETLEACRARFDRKWKIVLKAIRRECFGFVSMLRTTHVTRSRGHAWHYHVHLFLELVGEIEDVGREFQSLFVEWMDSVAAEGNGSAADCFVRTVAPAGPAMREVVAEQGDFWEERPDEVTRSLQYVIRDACQGVESWNLGLDGDDVVREAFESLEFVKMQRLYGEWRREVVDRFGKKAEEPPRAPVVNEDPQFIDGEIDCGTVDTVLHEALSGGRTALEVVRWLVQQVRNTSSVGKRMLESLSRLGR